MMVGLDTRWMMVSGLLLVAVGCPSKSESLGEEPTSEEGGDAGSEGSGGSTESGGTDVPAPVQVWTHIENDVTGTRLALAPDGSIYVAGYTGYTFEGGDGGFYDAIWIGKYTADGAPTWTVEIPGDGESLDAPNDIAATSDSGFVLVTEDFTVESGAGNAATRYDAAGQPMWTVEFDGRPATVAVGPDDAIVVGGLQTATPNNYVGLAMGFAGDGTPTWSATHGDEAARSLIGDVDIGGEGSVYLAGRMGVESGSTRSRAWLHLAAADGTAVWDLQLSDAIATDEVYEVDVTPAGVAVALVGADETSVRAFDAEGTELWSTTPSVVARNLASDAQGGFVTADGETLMVEGEECGYVGSFATCPSQMRVARAEAGGALRWLAIDASCDYGQDTAIAPDGRVVVLAGCPAEQAGTGMVASGLFLYADP